MRPQRQRFTLPDFVTTQGKRIPRVDIGFETYGTLNADRSNALLVCHYFSGNAHAAGKYSEDDALPGWWDAAIGPGKPLDTDQYFIISSDSLINLNTRDGQTFTTGPASIDPETGRPYGCRFPILDVEDFVRAQKKLVEHLGIDRLVAVAGPSAGSVLAIQWSVDYPDCVPRVLAVISPGLYVHPYAAAMLECWTRPILVDPAWKNGEYDPDEPPLFGLAEAFRLTTLTALSYQALEHQFGYAPADAAKNPSETLSHEFKADAMLGALASARAKTTDANHFLYAVRAYKLYDVRPRIAEAKAKYLFLPSATDLIFPAHLSETAVAELKKAGKSAELALIRGTGGHLDGLSQLAQHQDRIQRFLSS
ncbi:MAG: Homoserine O-acetyltransferase [Betaproteobacteria bacterium ADurb.Bin341]|nr:MAG: Homoserine O-acetyltransferase [Betaproteobacteria bacterium ADurb.Bin341]